MCSIYEPPQDSKCNTHANKASLSMGSLSQFRLQFFRGNYNSDPTTKDYSSSTSHLSAPLKGQRVYGTHSSARRVQLCISWFRTSWIRQPWHLPAFAR